MSPSFFHTARGHLSSMFSSSKPTTNQTVKKPSAPARPGPKSEVIGKVATNSSALSADEYSYIFTAFTNESESNLYVFTSIDALNFTLLKGPAFQPSGTLIRDPSVHLLPNGTYLLTYTPSWEGRDIGLAKSTDLQNWTYTETLTVPEFTFPEVTRTWAPEFFFDPITSKLHIIVSISPDLSNFRPVYFTFEEDAFVGTQWTGPHELEGLGRGNAIDMFAVYDEKSGLYHGFLKNETTKFIEHATAEKFEGPWRYQQTGNFSKWGKCEGPCLTILPDGKTYRIYADAYDDGKYIFADSEDLYNWGESYEVPSGLSGFVRHGTVLRVPTK